MPFAETCGLKIWIPRLCFLFPFACSFCMQVRLLNYLRTKVHCALEFSIQIYICQFMKDNEFNTFVMIYLYAQKIALSLVSKWKVTGISFIQLSQNNLVCNQLNKISMERMCKYLVLTFRFSCFLLSRLCIMVTLGTYVFRRCTVQISAKSAATLADIL
jgi:hypothetical protein